MVCLEGYKSPKYLSFCLKKKLHLCTMKCKLDDKIPLKLFIINKCFNNLSFTKNLVVSL